MTLYIGYKQIEVYNIQIVRVGYMLFTVLVSSQVKDYLMGYGTFVLNAQIEELQ